MTYRQVLRQLAFETHGVVTLKAAAERGVPAAEVRKLASRGALERRGKSVYRMVEVPHTPLDEFAEAVAVVGPSAVLADESVLAALDLVPVNLRRIKVATTRRVRHRIPPTIEVVRRHVEDSARADIEGIPAMSLPASILAARRIVLPERLIEAVHAAATRQLISPLKRDELLDALTRQPRLRPGH